MIVVMNIVVVVSNVYIWKLVAIPLMEPGNVLVGAHRLLTALDSFQKHKRPLVAMADFGRGQHRSAKQGSAREAPAVACRCLTGA